MTTTTTARVTTPARGSASPAVPTPTLFHPGTVTIPAARTVPGDGSTPCPLCSDTGTVFGWGCPVHPRAAGNYQFPISYAIEEESTPGHWTVTRQGVLTAERPTSALLNAVVATVALVQVATAGDSDAPIRVSAASTTLTGVPLCAYQGADPQSPVGDAVERLMDLLERLYSTTGW